MVPEDPPVPGVVTITDMELIVTAAFVYPKENVPAPSAWLIADKKPNLFVAILVRCDPSPKKAPAVTLDVARIPNGPVTVTDDVCVTTLLTKDRDGRVVTAPDDPDARLPFTIVPFAMLVDTIDAGTICGAPTDATATLDAPTDEPRCPLLILAAVSAVTFDPSPAKVVAVTEPATPIFCLNVCVDAHVFVILTKAADVDRLGITYVVADVMRPLPPTVTAIRLPLPP